MDNQTKKFHFQELNWLIAFPTCGNSGKYNSYTVTLKKGNAEPERQVKLGDILENPEFEQRYPHTVGYFKHNTGNDAEFKPEYMELRKIRTIEEFWMFLNALNL